MGESLVSSTAIIGLVPYMLPGLPFMNSKPVNSTQSRLLALGNFILCSILDLLFDFCLSYFMKLHNLTLPLI